MRTLARIALVLARGCFDPKCAPGCRPAPRAPARTVTSAGAVRCWGNGDSGRLGYGNTNTIGDNETPRSAGQVGFGSARALEVAAGGSHTCGQLGSANPESIGDNETLGAVGMPGHVMLSRSTAGSDMATTSRSCPDVV